MQASDTSTQPHSCPVCKAKTQLFRAYGAHVCRGCASFFIRCLKRQAPLECKNEAVTCSDSSVYDLTAYNACKNCRFRRCLNAGMNPSFWNNRPNNNSVPLLIMPKADLNLPLITQALEALSLVNSYQASNEALRGTSEPAQFYLSGLDSQRLYINESCLYRQLLDHLPVIRDLETDVKDGLFKNSLCLYTIYHQCVLNAGRFASETARDKLYIHHNAYIDLNETKIVRLVESSVEGGLNDHSAIESCRVVGRAFLKLCVSVRELISSCDPDLVSRREDHAVLLLLIVMHTCRLYKHNGRLEQALARLQSLWSEMARHYRTPDTWGSLVLLLSQLESASAEFKETATMYHLFVKGTVYDDLVGNKVPAIHRQTGEQSKS